MREKTPRLTAMVILVAMLLFSILWLTLEAEKIEQECFQLQEELLKLRAENNQLHGQIEGLRDQQADIGQRMQDWLDEWAVDVWESSAYAPLDPRAEEGMCYIGDPAVTASGARVVPGTTAAAGPDVPFGTLIKVEGAGWWVVQDRGGGVGNRCIDLAVQTREEALCWGRRQVKVVYRKWARS